jgi:hypothetical protein
MTSTLLSLVLFADQASYDAGRIIGRIVAYVLIGAVVLWLIGKVLRR